MRALRRLYAGIIAAGAIAWMCDAHALGAYLVALGVYGLHDVHRPP